MKPRDLAQAAFPGIDTAYLMRDIRDMAKYGVRAVWMLDESEFAFDAWANDGATLDDMVGLIWDAEKSGLDIVACSTDDESELDRSPTYAEVVEAIERGGNITIEGREYEITTGPRRAFS